MTIEEIIVATTNRGKLAEMAELLAEESIRVRGLADFQAIPEAPETSETLADNARDKALYYAQKLGGTVLADDSGLEVDALNGRPGVHSARFAGVDGPGRDQANNDQLLQQLSDTPEKQRTARFRCCLCLRTRDTILYEAEGHVDGWIAYTPAGTNGFGYDPLFFIPEKGCTAAELPSAEKNAISHRGRAIQKLITWLKTNAR